MSANNLFELFKIIYILAKIINYYNQFVFPIRLDISIFKPLYSKWFQKYVIEIF